jgi:DNA-binding NtrC family response regulator
MENSKKRILYVEDENSTSQLINRLLAGTCDVVNSTNLEDVLNKLKDGKFAAFISDGNYPSNQNCGLKKDAWKDFYQAVRALDKNAPFILHTTNNYAEGEVEKYTNNDANFLLVGKPISAEIKEYISKLDKK